MMSCGASCLARMRTEFLFRIALAYLMTPLLSLLLRTTRDVSDLSIPPLKRPVIVIRHALLYLRQRRI